MKYLFDAALFLARVTSGRCGETVCRDIMLETESSVIPAKVYQHPDTKKITGTVISVAGLSVYGIDDPRIVLLNRAIARSGFLVISPLFQEIRTFTITSASIDRLVEASHAVMQRKELCPSGTVSFIAPSFSGGICLAAAAKRENVGRINSVCTIGTFSNVRNVLRYLMESPESDEYGRLIVLKNFIHYALGMCPELERALELAYLDNGYQREIGELDSWLTVMSPLNRRLFFKLMDDIEFRTAVWEDIENKMRYELDIFEQLDVVSLAGTISGHCVFIHGERDDVIPPSESVMMHEAVLRAGGESTLAVTPLISHGDTRYTITMLPKLLKLISAFGNFFRSASISPLALHRAMRTDIV